MTNIRTQLINYINENMIDVNKLAERLNYDKNLFFKQLNGESEMYIDDLANICAVLNIQPSYFYNEESRNLKPEYLKDIFTDEKINLDVLFSVKHNPEYPDEKDLIESDIIARGCKDKQEYREYLERGREAIEDIIRVSFKTGFDVAMLLMDKEPVFDSVTENEHAILKYETKRFFEERN